ncbi:MAG: division/cell wall cluster transcriptional repressor MraZ [Ruminococcaceae bacterium]|nr:division/cell wall cluster transcriptional repressor MraZ [Oscillospiraceae bacterium]
MFRGEFACSLDDKSRLTVPSGYREGLGEVFYITKGLDKCLFVFPEDKWEEFEATINALPLSGGRKTQRFFISGAKKCTPDKQGRVVLDQSLKKYAEITERDVVVIGVSDRLEIWSKEKWESYSDIDPDEIAQIMEEMNV